MIQILLVSNEDVCRSRIAQALLESFGRGMKITTAGVAVPSVIPRSLRTAMDENGLQNIGGKPQDAALFEHTPWDCILTLCPEAESYVKELGLSAKYYHAFDFKPIEDRDFQNEGVLRDQLTELHDTMYRELYKFHRDVLSDIIMPMCTCGANTYCRCE